MSASAASSPAATPSAWSRVRPSIRGRIHFDRGSFVFGVVMLLAGVAAAYELVHGSTKIALGLSFVPLAIWLATHPTVPLVFLGVSLPAITSLGAGEYSTGYKFAASDLLLVMVSAGIVLEWTTAERPVPVIRALRPIARPVLQYVAVILLLLSFHHSLRDVLKTGQRYELFLLPLIVGAFAAMVGRHIQILKGYVLVCTALAVLFPVYSFGLQHNPIGGFIGNAILVMIAVRPLRRLYPCLFLLGPGLILTLSRGAILATALGVGVILALNLSGRRPALGRVLPLVLVGLAAFAAAPTSIQDRLTTFSSTPQNGSYSSGQYAIHVRQQYAADAHKIIAAHPLNGVGIGNYYNADVKVAGPGASQDPHEVFLLQAAEGGYPLAVSFAILLAGVLLTLRRMRGVDVGAAAVGVFLATAAHGLVDVYWVRGTPILAWLLVGMACGSWAMLRERGPAP